MTTELNADAFKGVICGIDPYISDIVFLCDLTCTTCKEEDVHQGVRTAHGLLKCGDTLEAFCQQTDVRLLKSMCEFCRDKWVELRGAS